MKNLSIAEKECMLNTYFKIDINKHGFQVSKYIMSLINGQLIQCIQHFNFSIDQGYALV